MSKYLFRYYNWSVIKKLLIEIGQYEYDPNLERMGLIEQKPISKDGFYLETNLDGIFLCYRYPSRTTFKIMKVDRYDNVPKDGWEIIQTSSTP